MGRFDVGGFDFWKQSSAHDYAGTQIPGKTSWAPSDWQYGYDEDDMNVARSKGASQYQLGQLMIEAGRRGIPIRKKVSDALSGWDPGPYDFAEKGGYGFGMADVNHLNDLDKVTEYSNLAGKYGLNIGSGVQDWIAARNNQKLEQDFAMQMAEYEQANRPLLRSGDPGAVGKPAAGLKVAQGNDYSKGRRGSTTLNRESAYFTNPLGGVTNSTGKKSNMNIA